jgi:hypothetical protein
LPWPTCSTRFDDPGAGLTHLPVSLLCLGSCVARQLGDDAAWWQGEYFFAKHSD